MTVDQGFPYTGGFFLEKSHFFNTPFPKMRLFVYTPYKYIE